VKNSIFLFFLFFWHSSYSAEAKVNIKLFSKTIKLPANCTLYTSSLLWDKPDIRYYCDKEELILQALIIVKRFEDVKPESLKSNKEVTGFQISKLSDLNHYRGKLSTQTARGIKSDEINIICDDKVCINIITSDEEVLRNIVAQLR
jgi:hypothetical protein